VWPLSSLELHQWESDRTVVTDEALLQWVVIGT